MSTNAMRVIYYGLCIALLIVFGVTLYQLLLAWLLALGAEAIIPNAIGLLAALVVGAWPYTWIRQDRAETPEAATSLVRSVLLNLTQVLAALFALLGGALTLAVIGYDLIDIGQAVSLRDIAGLLSTTVAALAVFGLVEYERERGRPISGGSRVMEQIHLYIVQAISILVVIFLLLISPRISPGFGVWLLVAPWGAGAWLLYRRLARDDVGSLLRLLAQLFGFGVGLACVVIGVYRLAYLALAHFLVLSYAPGGDWFTQFIAPVLVGLLVTGSYGLWLARESRQNGSGRRGTMMGILALSAVVVGVPFYVGLVFLLQGITLALQKNVPGSHEVALSLYALGGALLLAGLAHVPLVSVLRLRGIKAMPPSDARQIYLLVGWALGLLAIALSAGAALNGAAQVHPNLLDYLLNIPKALQTLLTVPQCVSTTHPLKVCPPATYAATYYLIPLLVGLFIVVIHYWRVRLENIQRPRSARSQSARVRAATILADLRAGRITREEAMTQLQILVDEAAGASRKPI